MWSSRLGSCWLRPQEDGGSERDLGAQTLGLGNWLDEKEVVVRVASWLGCSYSY